jgi:hypothetical protein
MAKELEDLIEWCRSNNRLFPKDIYWGYLCRHILPANLPKVVKPPEIPFGLPWMD